jgi:DNA-binding CsgD family transcriptional regulator
MLDASATGWDELFWAAFEAATNAMSVLDERRTRIAVNQALCAYLGRPRETLLGRRFDLDLSTRGSAGLEAAWRAVHQNGRWQGEIEQIRGDGAALRSQMLAQSVMLDGREVVLFAATNSAAGGILPEIRADLTPRERAVLQLLTLGLSSAEIAERLSISTETVRTHVRNAMRKTGARTRAQLVAEGFGDPPSEV